MPPKLHFQSFNSRKLTNKCLSSSKSNRNKNPGKFHRLKEQKNSDKVDTYHSAPLTNQVVETKRQRNRQRSILSDSRKKNNINNRKFSKGKWKTLKRQSKYRQGLNMFQRWLKKLKSNSSKLFLKAPSSGIKKIMMIKLAKI